MCNGPARRPGGLVTGGDLISSPLPANNQPSVALTRANTQSLVAHRETLVPSVLSNRLRGGDLLSRSITAAWLNCERLLFIKTVNGTEIDGRVDLREPHAVLIVNVTSHYSAGRIALRRREGRGDWEELCWCCCQQSDRQQMGNEQDLINVFSLGELCFLDLNRFEGITYLPSKATPVLSPALCNCSTPRKQEWGGLFWAEGKRHNSL